MGMTHFVLVVKFVAWVNHGVYIFSVGLLGGLVERDTRDYIEFHSGCSLGESKDSRNLISKRTQKRKRKNRQAISPVIYR